MSPMSEVDSDTELRFGACAAMMWTNKSYPSRTINGRVKIVLLIIKETIDNYAMRQWLVISVNRIKRRQMNGRTL